MQILFVYLSQCENSTMNHSFVYVLSVSLNCYVYVEAIIIIEYTFSSMAEYQKMLLKVKLPPFSELVQTIN